MNILSYSLCCGFYTKLINKITFIITGCLEKTFAFYTFFMFSVVLTLLLLSSKVTSQSVPDVEINALFALYNSTNGEFWLWRNELTRGLKWNFAQAANGNFLDNPCNSGSSNKAWQGVTCSNPPPMCVITECHIVQLLLIGYNLTGPIPPQIGDRLTL